MTKTGLGPLCAKSVGTEHGCPPSPAALQQGIATFNLQRRLWTSLL